MILCFSGTGNSVYVAKKISNVINENIVSINEYIKNGKNYTASENERFVFVVPTYAWRIPKIVESWIKGIRKNGTHKAYFVMTCGGNISNSEKYIQALCAETGIEFLGCAGIVMPENYIAMFDVPEKEEAIRIIEKSDPYIHKIAELIKENKPFGKANVSVADKVQSGFVNKLFYPVFVHSKKFYAKENCIGCGKCEKLCPLNNISIKDGKPIWQDNCTHCMACICHCPVNAIEYSNKSENKPRYTCPL